MRELLFAASLALCAALACPAGAETPPRIDDGLYVYDGYDAARDPGADLAAAKQRASAEGKLILMEVGGDWCVWCKILDAYLNRNAEVRAAFLETFVVFKVNYSRENQNEAFLGKFPEAPGYPAYFVLDPHGRLLEVQSTGELESGRSYDRARMLEFAGRWRAAGAASAASP